MALTDHASHNVGEVWGHHAKWNEPATSQILIQLRSSMEEERTVGGRVSCSTELLSGKTKMLLSWTVTCIQVNITFNTTQCLMLTLTLTFTLTLINTHTKDNGTCPWAQQWRTSPKKQWKHEFWAGAKAHWVKTLAAEPGDLSSISGTHMGERETQLLPTVL